MSLDGRFHRLGERRRELVVLNDDCIDLTCWDPRSLMEGRRELLLCNTRAESGCPDPDFRILASAGERQRRRKEWVKS